MIHNHMVIDEQKLDLVFNALADKTRRAMLATLSEGQSNISTLAAPHKMSQPAISKHMRVLERAGLIKRTKNGREHIISVAPAPAKQVGDWIAFYTSHWIDRFDAVDTYLTENKLHNPKN